MPRTIVLAYSGGLDTSIIVPWLREHYDARVICVAADIGQGQRELAGVRTKAIASGAEECFVEDLREEFVRDFMPTSRSSTRSTTPTPCLPPMPLSASTSATGSSCSPFTDTGVPCSNPMTTVSGRSGASKGVAVS